MAHPRASEFQELLLTVNQAIQGLGYLAAIDAALIPDTSATPHGYPLTVVDAAHARWAASTAITALDLCAAIMGRLYPDPGRKYAELDVRSAKQDATIRAHSVCRRWVNDVCRDEEYRWLDSLRTAFVHRDAAPKVVVAVVSQAGQPSAAVMLRPQFRVLHTKDGRTVERRVVAPTVITLATDVASRHFGRFRTELEGGRI